MIEGKFSSDVMWNTSVGSEIMGDGLLAIPALALQRGGGVLVVNEYYTATSQSRAGRLI
jgi:hypothetical protein